MFGYIEKKQYLCALKRRKGCCVHPRFSLNVPLWRHTVSARASSFNPQSDQAREACGGCTKPFYIMYLDSAKKAEIFAQYGKDAKNTGSAESQIALFTFRIKHLTEHMKKNHKDVGTARALSALVGKRRSMLDYLKAQDIERYRALIKELGIRK